MVPAFDTVGKSSRLTETVALEGGHEPLLITHSKIFKPTPRAVIPVVGELGLVIFPEPKIKFHCPVPTVGVLPLIVAVVAQTVWLTLTVEVVGLSSLIISTVEELAGQTPLLIVH